MCLNYNGLSHDTERRLRFCWLRMHGERASLQVSAFRGSEGSDLQGPYVHVRGSCGRPQISETEPESMAESLQTFFEPSLPTRVLFSIITYPIVLSQGQCNS
jgi:hypothetical protein